MTTRTGPDLEKRCPFPLAISIDGFRGHLLCSDPSRSSFLLDPERSLFFCLILCVPFLDSRDRRAPSLCLKQLPLVPVLVTGCHRA